MFLESKLLSALRSIHARISSSLGSVVDNRSPDEQFERVQPVASDCSVRSIDEMI